MEGGKTSFGSIYDPGSEDNHHGFARRDARAEAAVTKGAAPSVWSSARTYAVLSIAAAVLTIGLKLGPIY